MLNPSRRRGEPAAGGLETRGDRRLALCIPVVVDPGANARDAAIVDLTTRGARLYFADPTSIATLCIGQQVAVRPLGGSTIPARLRWRDERHCGVQFVVPIQAETVMRFESDPGLWLRSRASRAKVALPVEIFVDGVRRAVRALDLSSGGARIRVRGGLPAGTPLMINLDGALPIAGYVRWNGEEDAGVMFTRLLPVASARHFADLCDLNPFWLRELIEHHRTSVQSA